MDAGAGEWLEERDLPEILRKVRPFTMVPQSSLVDLARQVRVVLEQKIPGALVECGSWRGGASFLMAEILRREGARDRKVWLLDSFEGIQPPQEIDGPAAKAWGANKAGPMYFDNLRAPLEEVRQAALDLGLSDHTELVAGWFDKTLPANRDRIGPIAILRIDADWYASVKCCLDELYDQVVNGGVIIFDDYYTWDGCAAAVHEFLGQRKVAHRIEGIGDANFTCAVVRKSRTTWRWMQQLHLLGQDLIRLVPQGAQVVLIDQDACRPMLATGHELLPFTERDAKYWGPPADDAAAIAELHRLGARGAKFVAVAWPAIWFLDHYPKCVDHLEREGRCLLRNERVILFELGRANA
ncbi:MAG TPA: TylF/MycF/NovP-related O-methyltransferase [Tepidisphaeraceae bacterium]|nr:TylF/MycF/NovP-related O-methyltransferase [Tepidisphaeraceae bacterium]